MSAKYQNRLLISSLCFKIDNNVIAKEDVKFSLALCRPYGFTEYGRDSIDFDDRKEVTDMFNNYYLSTTHLYSELADLGMELMVDYPVDQNNVNASVVELNINDKEVTSHVDYSWIMVYVSMSGLIFPITIVRLSDEGECITSPSSIDFNLKLKL